MFKTNKHFQVRGASVMQGSPEKRFCCVERTLGGPLIYRCTFTTEADPLLDSQSEKTCDESLLGLHIVDGNGGNPSLGLVAQPELSPPNRHHPQKSELVLDLRAALPRPVRL